MVGCTITENTVRRKELITDVEIEVIEQNKIDDKINRLELIKKFEDSKKYYENIGRFDYSSGFEKAIYLTATHNKESIFSKIIKKDDV